jgi:adenylyl cyclase-associated protein
MSVPVMGGNGLDPKVLIGIIHRLEAATSRLEDIATSTLDPPAQNNAVSTPAATPAAPPAAPLASQRPAPAPAPAAAPKQVQEPLPESIEEFDEFLSTVVQKYVSLSDAIGGALSQQVYLFDPKYVIQILIVP